MSQSELKNLQDRRLRELVSFAYERVPYYHRLFREKGLRTSDFNSIEDLSKLPILDKAVILGNSPDGMLARGVRIMATRTTSGTTGLPTRFCRGPVTQRRILALKLRRMQHTGVKWWEKAVYMPYWGADVEGRAAFYGPKVSNLTNRLASMPHRARHLVIGYRVMPLAPGNLEAVSKMLARYKPSILSARPSYLWRVAGILKELALPLKVKKIFTEGEILTKGTREDLRSAYGAEVFDEYGSSEFSGLGSECKAHRGIHLNSDYFVFEFVGKDGYPARKGEKAELIVTGLMDDAMPLIRYRIGDYVVKGAEETCECGSSLPRLKLIEGRTFDGLIGGSGEAIASGSIVEFLETDLGLRGFQIVQEEEREFLIKVRKTDLDGRTIEAVRDYLSNVLGGQIKLRSRVWGNGEMPIKFRPVMRAADLKDTALELAT